MPAKNKKNNKPPCNPEDNLTLEIETLKSENPRQTSPSILLLSDSNASLQRDSSIQEIRKAPSKASATSLKKQSFISVASMAPSCGKPKYTASNYNHALEREYESLQTAFFSLTSHFAKVQFRLRQIIQAKPNERDRLVDELTQIAFSGVDEIDFNSLPKMMKDIENMGNIRRRQGNLFDKLREQMQPLCDFFIKTSEKCVRIDESATKWHAGNVPKDEPSEWCAKERTDKFAGKPNPCMNKYKKCSLIPRKTNPNAPNE